MTTTDELEFPDKGILWRSWDDETLRVINEKRQPVLLFVADADPFIWPFLRETFGEMPKNAKLRHLLHARCPALYIEADKLPEELTALGAGSRFHIAILSPYGLTPLVTIDAVSGRPEDVVARIVSVLDRILEAWH